MDETYRWWLSQNEKSHIFLEDSLGYGLGLPYLAFAGHVACWNDYPTSPRGTLALTLALTLTQP